jgi:hypothetical protein
VNNFREKMLLEEKMEAESTKESAGAINVLANLTQTTAATSTNQ